MIKAMILISMMSATGQPTESPLPIDYCDLEQYWTRSVAKLRIPAELESAVISMAKPDGWKGSYQVRVTIADGHLLEPELVWSDSGGPSDEEKIALTMIWSGAYVASRSNSERRSVRVVLTNGPMGLKIREACPTQ